MHVYFCCICFSFSVLSQEVGWEERLRNDLFCVEWEVKPQLNTLTFALLFSVDCLCVGVGLPQHRQIKVVELPSLPAFNCFTFAFLILLC